MTVAVQSGVDGRVFHRHLVGRQAHLLGDDGREHVADALPHFALVDENDDGALVGDRDPRTQGPASQGSGAAVRRALDGLATREVDDGGASRRQELSPRQDGCAIAVRHVRSHHEHFRSDCMGGG